MIIIIYRYYYIYKYIYYYYIYKYTGYVYSCYFNQQIKYIMDAVFLNVST